MTFSTFMVLYALVSAMFGIGFVFVPGQLFSIYGIAPNAALTLTGQLFGAALLSLAILAWSARDADDSEARGAIISALFFGETLGFILALMGQIKGVFNALGWLVVAVYLLLALGFAYFRFAEPSS